METFSEPTVETTEHTGDNANTEIVRIDGDLQRVSDAYDQLTNQGIVDGVDTGSPLNLGSHPQSATALDLKTGDLAGVRSALSELGFDDIIADHPPQDESIVLLQEEAA